MPKISDIPTPGVPPETPAETIEREVATVRDRIERALIREFKIQAPSSTMRPNKGPHIRFQYGVTPIRVDVYADPDA